MVHTHSHNIILLAKEIKTRVEYVVSLFTESKSIEMSPAASAQQSTKNKDNTTRAHCTGTTIPHPPKFIRPSKQKQHNLKHCHLAQLVHNKVLTPKGWSSCLGTATRCCHSITTNRHVYHPRCHWRPLREGDEVGEHAASVTHGEKHCHHPRRQTHWAAAW